MNCSRFSAYIVAALCLTITPACSISKVFVSQPPIRITAESLTSAYAEDELAADKKYKDKPLEVNGIIEQLIVTEKGGRGILLKGGNTRYLSSVLCSITNEQGNTFEGLKEGQRVTVAGRCEGFLLGMSVDLANCSIKRSK